jgi:tRNA dimethylallyltransferase
MVTAITKVKSRILLVVGPTASGKSTLGVRIARILDGEIISADSRQMYSDLTIGTAKPSAHDRGGIPHHFIDCYQLDHHCTAGQFSIESERIITEIISRNHVPVIVGGSGLYIQALVDGIFEAPEAPIEIRQRLYERLHREGSSMLLEELRAVDPVIAQTMNPRTTHRIIRALEVYEHTGIPLSSHHIRQTRESRYDSFPAGLAWDRTQLYERINKRVDSMIDEGLIDEVKHLDRRGYTESLHVLQTVGYQEVFAFLRGKYSETEMIRLIKRNTRRYAKRQLTWFRRDKRIHWYPISDESEIRPLADLIVSEFRSFPVGDDRRP